MSEIEEILDYYNAGAELDRLSIGIGKLEFERTKDLISRYLDGGSKVIANFPKSSYSEAPSWCLKYA